MSHVCNGIYSHPCTGCGMCSAICPKGALQMHLSEDGFYIPSVDENLCVHCGLCRKVCYRANEFNTANQTKLPIACYSAVNTNTDELKKASSGAVSIELMRACIKNGYAVVGVEYDSETESAVTRIAHTESELNAFRGSKYFQSNTADAFRAVLQDTSPQRYAIFGTPCQIYAFQRAADVQRNMDKYLFIDIFCHGCPSMNLWKKYLDYEKSKYDVSEFDEIRFRSKTHGWHEFCFDFIKDSKQYSSSKYNDPFYALFFGMDCMNEACYDCAPRSSVAWTDIRLGDFWGWQFDENTQGVSAVILMTERGAALFDSVKDKFSCQSFAFQDIVEAQSYGKEHTIHTERRKRLLIELMGNEPLNIVRKNYIALLPYKYRIKQAVKRTLKHLPNKIYLKLKQKTHQR